MRSFFVVPNNKIRLITLLIAVAFYSQRVHSVNETNATDVVAAVPDLYEKYKTMQPIESEIWHLIISNFDDLLH